MSTFDRTLPASYMATFCSKLPAFCVITWLLAATCWAQATNQPQALFDGQSLISWEGDPEYWRVENGSIVGEIPAGQTLRKNTWLVWRDGELTDFDLRLQVKLTGAAAANSGIQFRCQVRDVDHVSGYQADLDQGATWLGRIYDEHGRALLVERGTRVAIGEDGTRRAEVFAPAHQYAVLFRENAWNDYRIVAVGEHVAVYINGTLFSQLLDQQRDQRDLRGSLAFQLHSGPETRVEFRDIQLIGLSADDKRLGDFAFRQPLTAASSDEGVFPKTAAGEALNMGFETGSLAGWKATGDAFQDQPVRRDGIADRWPGQVSNKAGNYFIGGFEVVQDGGTGTLTSPAFSVTHPYASFLIAGGDANTTRVEIVESGGDQEEKVIFTAVGDRREQMRRVAVDLGDYQGRRVFVRLVDESTGGWGHLNFDDFRFHDQRPVATQPTQAWRSTSNPLLNHLVPNPADAPAAGPAAATIAQMHVPEGFSVHVVAAEPRLHQPMAFCFDARGRLWVVEGHSYPQKRPAGEGLDRVLIFADEDGDGQFESSKVFCEGLNLVSGMAVGHGGVWIGAAPELLFIADRDGDDLPDGPPLIMLDGFGYADTHETLNSFVWGPDGWLYGNQGVFNNSRVGQPGTPDAQRVALSAGVWRFHPTRHVFEVFAHGGSNQWGLDFDEFGQLFMTHCRSRWGQGPTTHVMQGGHYWNQVNSGYAAFISAAGLPQLPAMRNYMLASARYGHGEGGAGKPGSREVYGGHSHVGTMIYLADNWPATYRNHLFTHNLHGHQINHQINLREAGGYNTVHAGYDVLFCADPQYIGVDLKYGPDGAVYISDWYDPRHCHNPDVEQWDRGNGRLYRMQYDASYRPVKVDLGTASDEALVEAQLSENDWYVRTARRVLHERSATGQVSELAIKRLKQMALTHPDAARRLRAVWALHAVSALDSSLAGQLVEDDHEYVRAWTVQLAVESLEADQLAPLLVPLVRHEMSLLVRRYLAAAVQRVPDELGWTLAATLAGQPENAADRELPLLLWYGIAGLMSRDLDRALALADQTQIATIRDYIHWYAAKASDPGRERMTLRLTKVDPAERQRLLSLMEFAVRGMRGLRPPQLWGSLAGRLYASSDNATRQAAESIGAAFGDELLLQRMRDRLSDTSTDTAQKRHALSVLASDSSPTNVPLLLELLNNESLVGDILPLLTRYNDDRIASRLIDRLPGWQGRHDAAAMEVLSSRAAWASAVLDAIAEGAIEKQQLTAYHVRRMSQLQQEALNERLAAEWGALQQTSDERRAEIAELVEQFNTAPLWAYDGRAGSQHFQKLCAACHQPNQQDESLGPRLAGSGSKGIEYIVENIVDPNAVIGRDYQARIIITLGGQVIQGLVESETPSAITIRTATNQVTIAKNEIDEITISTNSFMPEGLLKDLNDRQRIELLKYLMAQ